LTADTPSRLSEPAPRKQILSLLSQAVGAVAFVVMFCAFILQVVSRYLFNAPLGWTSEVCVIAYLWIAFWGGGLMLRRQDQVRFDLLYQRMAPQRRRIMALMGSTVLLGIYAWSFLPNADFIKFMGQDRTWVLELRFDLVFSVFLIFLVGMIVQTLRHILRLSGNHWRRSVGSPEP